MANLSDYMAKAFEKGFSKKEIVDLLLEKGYSMREINLSLNSLNKGNIGKNNIKQEYKIISNINKIKLLFSKPVSFFEQVKDVSIGKSIILFLITFAFASLLGLAIGFLLSLVLMRGYGSILSFGISSIFSIVIYVFIFAFTFIYAGISHLVIKLCKGAGTYSDTYNAITYSFVPFLLLTAIPILGYLSFIYSLVLMSFGLYRYHNISKGKAVFAALAPVLILVVLVVLLFIFVLYSFRGIY